MSTATISPPYMAEIVDLEYESLTGRRNRKYLGQLDLAALVQMAVESEELEGRRRLDLM